MKYITSNKDPRDKQGSAKSQRKHQSGGVCGYIGIFIWNYSILVQEKQGGNNGYFDKKL